MSGIRWIGAGVLWVIGCAACGPSTTDGGGEGDGTGGQTTGSPETGELDASGGPSDASGGPADNRCECQPEPSETQICERDELAVLAPGCGFEDEVALHELDCVFDDMGGTEDAVLSCTEGDPDARAGLVAALRSGSPAVLVVTTEIFEQELGMDAYLLRGDGTGTKIDCYVTDAPPAQVEVLPAMFTSDAVVECLQVTDVAESVRCVADAVASADPLAACE